jgi:hypothetical protein
LFGSFLALELRLIRVIVVVSMIRVSEFLLVLQLIFLERLN